MTKQNQAELRKLNEAELKAKLAEAKASLAANPNDSETKEVSEFITELLTNPNPPNRAIKPGMVKVRAGNQAVNVDGIHIAAKAEGEVPEKRLASLGGLVTKVGCLLLGCMLLAGTLHAQQYSTPALASGGTNFVAAASTNTYGPITLTKNEDFGLFLSAAAISASTSNTVWYVDVSLDNTNGWTTVNAITKAQTGTTAVGVTTNITVGSVGYARVRCAIPDNLVAVTNVTVRYSLKPTRHGG